MSCRRWLSAAAILGALGFPSSAGAEQGVYDQCSPVLSPDGCAGRLSKAGQAGFTVVVASSALSGSDADIRRYEATARGAGLRIIWPIHVMSKDRALSLVPLLRTLPGTWGYYLADEPRPGDYDALRAFADQVKVADPAHERLIVGCGVCDDDLAWLAGIDAAIGTDAYPVIGGSPDPAFNYASVVRTAGHLKRFERRVAVLQAWRWGDSASDAAAIGVDPATTRFPERDEITAQRDGALDAGDPRLVLWFMLPQVLGWEPGQRPANWSDPPDPARRWANLTEGAFAPYGAWRGAGTSTSGGTNSESQAAAGPVARLRYRRLDRRGSRRRYLLDARPSTGAFSYRWHLDGRRLVGLRATRKVWVRRYRKHRVTVTALGSGTSSATRTFRAS